MRLIHGERGAGTVTYDAALADSRRVCQRVRRRRRAYVASNASRRCRLRRVDVALRVLDVVYSSRYKLGSVYVALAATSGIARRSLGAHQWESHLREVIDTAIPADDCITLSGFFKVL